METFRTLREGFSDKDERNINSYLKSVKEDNVKIESARYLSENGTISAVIDMKPFLMDKVEFEFGGSREYFNVWYHQSAYSRLCADDFVNNWNGLQILKDAVREYVDENKINRHKSTESDNTDHDWLLNNKGWM